MHDDIENFSTQQLLTEALRRCADINIGFCPYCSRPVETHTCKYAGRMNVFHDVVEVAQLWNEEPSHVK